MSTSMSWLAGLTLITNVAAMHITEMPRAESTTISTTSPTTVTPDPWQCVTENITQYFIVPRPTGTLLDALISYGDDLLKPCLATATGRDALSCSVSETTSWCGFTTAAPSGVLSEYSSYGSAAASFWEAKSETMSIIASDCPVGWAKPGFSERAWLNQAIAHAECYIEAHPTNSSSVTSAIGATSTTVSGSTAKALTPTTNSVVARTQGVDSIVLASTGLAVAMNAMW